MGHAEGPTLYALADNVPDLPHVNFHPGRERVVFENGVAAVDAIENDFEDVVNAAALLAGAVFGGIRRIATYTLHFLGSDWGRKAQNHGPQAEKTAYAQTQNFSHRTLISFVLRFAPSYVLVPLTSSYPPFCPPP
jgi:hypothetical protein